jgi:hypothetical protein
MNAGLRQRFWIESAMALVSGVLVLITLIWKDWIEKVFNVDPDSHNGSVEWLIVAIALAITVTSVTLARYEWQHRSVVSA